MARMRFRPFRLKALLPYLSIAMIYPVIALITSEKKLLKFIDAMTITGVVFLILGIIGNLTRHGDFDITEYIARRSLRRGGHFRGRLHEIQLRQFPLRFITGRMPDGLPVLRVSTGRLRA